MRSTRSAITTWARTPRPRISEASSSTDGRERLPWMITSAPASARARATARPIPEVDPRTAARRPSRLEGDRSLRIGRREIGSRTDWCSIASFPYIQLYPSYPGPVPGDKPIPFMHPHLHRVRGALLRLQTLWSIVGLTLLLVLVLELALRGCFWLKDRRTVQPPPDRRVIEEGYHGALWPVAHYRELNSLWDQWHPYVYFRQRPFRGETINIDQDGLRAIWQPPSAKDGVEESNPPLKILMLGGSSLWGFGARDDYTIPSLIAHGLHEIGVAVEVRN